MILNTVLYLLLNTIFVVAISPLAMTLIKKVKAYTQGRVGPPLLQGYYNLFKLFKKEIVYSPNSSFIMRLAPYLNIGFLLAASVMVPVVFLPQVSGIGNIILFLYLMVTAKFFMALAGLDAGSTFGGMGSSREMSLSAIIEPVTITSVAALAFVLKSTDIPEMFATTLNGSLAQYPTLILVAFSLFIVIIVETARVPVDNPETHLELTMIHEAMILEQTGPKLALMELSQGVKQTILMALLINIVWPVGLASNAGIVPIAVSMASFAAKVLTFSIVVGVFESMMAKIRLFRLPSFFMLALFFSFATIVFELLA
ncbi:Formate hydrogenlyase subunit 4 [Dehalogenimonas formicexedens]|uniref:Formate hydrogenlyase subunit 4 n=1 Tax=Dehalogenimonas formicexedens TaxID=1839801 RepID=A0A1P8F9R2_9CHLR|nr:NADH-quinone oxidoreductase subunit H [Dehalogenimonas formicexedens]APV45183.1 Formate hydrogenlyase subunit 4 [Dehalogenimonas formicexedens]